MNILTVGLPNKAFIDHISSQEEVHLYITESRPYETEIALLLSEISPTLKTTLLTDNMIASLCSEVSIDHLFCFGSDSTDDSFLVYSGTQQAITIANHFSIPVHLYKTEVTSPKTGDHFFDTSIVVKGASLLPVTPETIEKTAFVEIV